MLYVLLALIILSFLFGSVLGRFSHGVGAGLVFRGVSDLGLEKCVGCTVLKGLILVGEDVALSTSDDKAATCREHSVDPVAEGGILEVVLKVAVVVADYDLALCGADVKFAGFVECVAGEVVG